MNASDPPLHTATWMKYLLHRFGHSAIRSRRSRRSLLLRRMMFTSRKPI
jgi:hypothetical protein